MPENEEQNQTPPNPLEAGETPPSTPPPAGEAGTPPPESAALEQTGFKWGDNAPDYLRGKDPTQTLDIVNRLATAVQQIAAQQQQSQTQVQPQVPQQKPIELDDDLLVTDPSEWRRQFQAQQEQRMAATMQQAAQPVFQNMAATAATLSQQDKANADVAERWWGEVNALVSGVPTNMHTKALYDQAVRVVRSNHIDEIATERAQALAAAQTGVETVTVSGTNGTAGVRDDDAVWTKFKDTDLGARMIERYGKAKVLQAAERMGGLEEYAKMVNESKTQFDPEHGGRMYTELA